MSEQRLRCTQANCQTPEEIAYLIVRDESGVAARALCASHVGRYQAGQIPGYHLEKIPDADSVKDRPLKMQPKPTEESLYSPVKISTSQPDVAHSPTPETKGPVMANAPMAPTDAIYDEDPGDTSFDPESLTTEDTAALDRESRAERKILTDEISANFRGQIGNKQIFEVQFTLRGDYSSDAFRRFVRKLISDQEFAVNAGLRGTIRPGMGVEAAVAPPHRETAPSLPATEAPPRKADAQPNRPRTAAPVSAPPRSNSGPSQGGWSTPHRESQPGDTGAFIATRMTVAPQPSGTTQLQFFEEGKDRSAISYTRKPTTLETTMQGCGEAWYVDDFLKAGNYTVNYRVDWEVTDSKPPGGSAYFKNIRVSPAQ